MSNPNDVLLEEARESFYQLENLASTIDNKAFGLVAIDTLFITISGYFFDKTDLDFDFWSIPIALFSASLLFMLLCAWPRSRRRQDVYETVRNYANKTSDEVAEQLMVNYATLSDDFGKNVYNKKVCLLCIGFAYTCIGFLLSIIYLLNY
jgi:hypothetical protein